MAKKNTKHNWHFGQNKTQRYYEAYVGKDTLLVFANSWDPHTWLGQYRIGSNDSPIFDKAALNRQRTKEGQPADCHPAKLRSARLSSAKAPEEMMIRVERCYAKRAYEI